MCCGRCRLKLSVALALAMALDRSVRGVTFYRAVFYLPSLLGASVAIAILWRQIFGGDGLVNKLLLMLTGWSGPSWVTHPDFALGTLVILANLAVRLADDHLPRRPAPGAAGNSTRRRPWMAPVRCASSSRSPCRLLAPVVFFNLVLQTIDAFKAFTQAFIVSGGQGGPVDSTMFYTLYLYLEAFANFRMGYASALAWLLLIIIGIFTGVAFLTSRYWVYYEDEGR